MQNAVVKAGTRLGRIGHLELKSAGYFPVGEDYFKLLRLLENEKRITPRALGLLALKESTPTTVSVAFVPVWALAIRGGGASEGVTMWGECLHTDFLPEWSRTRLDTDHVCHLLPPASLPYAVASHVMSGCGGTRVWCGSKPLAQGPESGAREGQGWFLFADMERRGGDIVWHFDVAPCDLRDPFDSGLVAFGVAPLQ